MKVGWTGGLAQTVKRRRNGNGNYPTIARGAADP